MKKLVGAMLFVFAVAVFSTVTFAQPGGGADRPGGRERGREPGGNFAGGGGGIELLTRNAEIKSRLGLTEEQVGKLGKLSEELRARPNDRRPGSGPPSREELQKFREEFEKRFDETQTKINQILTPEQQEKYKTLQFQLIGGLDSPLLRVRSLEVLNLTEEQKAKLKTINDEREAESRAAFEKRGPIDWRKLSQEEREKLGAELQAENETRTKKFAEQIKAVLTPEQKEKAEKLTAEAKEVQEKIGFGIGIRERRGGENRSGRGEGGEYRPDRDSWRPGQGAGERGNQNRQPRRTFPQTENP
ncbi:MAG: Spy/CpxP family protein refolding chaperone [Planctomycetaceae bacterium]|jgi:Spy/CpxP family protein refolding chaperone|nr:Spy/CpxP family protein refolding chaperone [Planctomycetaceae bacterium]